jgi:hypothetical protein
MALPGRAAESVRAERRLRGGGGWIWTAGLMLLAAVVAGALPAASQRVAQTLRTRPGFALLAGFIALVCVPVAALVFFITIIGAPLGLLTLLLYFVLLLLGYVATSITLGDWALQRWNTEAAAKTGWRAGAAVLAVFVLGLLGSVPWLGGLLAVVAMLVGIGAIVLQLTPRSPPAAA